MSLSHTRTHCVSNLKMCFFLLGVFLVFCVGKAVSVGRDLQNSIYQCVNFCCEGERERERENGKRSERGQRQRKMDGMGWEE